MPDTVNKSLLRLCRFGYKISYILKVKNLVILDIPSLILYNQNAIVFLAWASFLRISFTYIVRFIALLKKHNTLTVFKCFFIIWGLFNFGESQIIYSILIN